MTDQFPDGPARPLPPIPIPQFDSAGQTVAWLGVDAARWTALFLNATDLANAGPDFVHTVQGWFANAIGAGQSSVHEVPERESWFSDAVQVETVSRPGGWLHVNLREVAADEKASDKVASIVFDKALGKATHEALMKWLYPDVSVLVDGLRAQFDAGDGYAIDTALALAQALGNPS